MNITIFGATGQVGSRILDEASARGHHVTAVTRSGTSADSRELGHMDRRRRPESPGREPPEPWTGHRHQCDVGSPHRRRRTRHHRPGTARRGRRTPMPDSSSSAAPGPSSYPTAGDASSSMTPASSRASIRGVAQACVDQLDVLRQDSTVDWTYFSPSAELTAGRRTGRFRTGTDELIVDSDGTSRISLEDVAVAVLDEAEQPRHVRAVLTAGYSHPVRHSRAVDPVTLRRAEVTP